MPKEKKTKEELLGEKPIIKSKGGDTDFFKDAVILSKKKKYALVKERKDVYVSINHHNPTEKKKTDYYTLSFAFRDKMWKPIVGDDEYILIIAFKNRIYFKVSNKEDGYKITVKGLNGVVSASLTEDERKTFAPFAEGIAEYHLKYDDFHELYYIELPKDDSQS